MSKIQPISFEHHAARRWKRPQGYRFAAADVVAPLAAQEFTQAMLAMPMAFISIDGAFQPVSVLGIRPGKNLYVALDGRWIAGYLPAVYKAYPFAIANTEDGNKVLCINEESGLVSDKDGEAFFDEDGQLAAGVAEVLGFLKQYAEGRGTALYLSALLDKYDVIRPWPLTLKHAGGEQTVNGLFRIDETLLNKLPADAYIALRDAGALVLANCQLMSMQHLPSLGQLADAHTTAATQASTKLPTKGKDLDLSFMSAGETFKFGG